jgi:hypothetical protein
MQGPKEGNECVSCGGDSKWRFFCEHHGEMFSDPVCDSCERAAEEDEAKRRADEEKQERRRQAAEERERRQQEYEREQQRKRDEAMAREKAFIRIAKIPASIALATTVLCMALAAQILTHGELVIPYTATIFFGLIGTGIVAAISILVIAVFFEF